MGKCGNVFSLELEDGTTRVWDCPRKAKSSGLCGRCKKTLMRMTDKPPADAGYYDYDDEGNKVYSPRKD